MNTHSSNDFQLERDAFGHVRLDNVKVAASY